MSKHSLRRFVRPTLEALEDRYTPAGTVTGTLSDAPAGGKVWTLTGDGSPNDILVQTAGNQSAFSVTGKFDTAIAGVTNPTGVAVIVFDMGGLSDVVQFEGNNVAKLRHMIFKGGSGDNVLNALRFKLTQNLQVINSIGFDATELFGFQIGGNISINNASGGSSIRTGSMGNVFSKVTGNVSISNSAGHDRAEIRDTNVGGNVTVNNGTGSAATGEAGYFSFYNLIPSRAVIGGTLSVTFQGGDVDPFRNRVTDAVIRGDALFSYSDGTAATRFDNIVSSQQVVIHGKLRISGNRANLVSIGREYLAKHSGLQVRGNLIIDVAQPEDLTLEAFNFSVLGQTVIM